MLAFFPAAYVLAEAFPTGFSYEQVYVTAAGGVLALLFLLAALHVHYMMVRSGAYLLRKLRPARAEFMSIVRDILHHREFIRLKQIHHHTGSLYDHVIKVAFLSYAWSKILSLDYTASARGGLLHDFFFYDWRIRKTSGEPKSLHGREHPHIALDNAHRFFSVTDREADIIVKHMFPKTRALPRYAESIVVSICDKLVTVCEYTFCRRQAYCQPN